MPEPLELFVRLAVALILGGVIGLERERQERAAGLRTVTMVSLGSCLFTLIGAYGFGDPSRVDPTRVAAQITTGIGFLGAGTIFLRKDLVRGLTTAATIWATAAIGMAAATGAYYVAVFCTLLILFVLTVLKPMERRFFRRPEQATVALDMVRRDDSLARLTRMLDSIGASCQAVQYQEVGTTHDRVQLSLEVPRGMSIADLLKAFRSVEGASGVMIVQDLQEDRVRLQA
ncbi:MAG TPA: MgtC/SapB family protein [Candidatus Limnocylindrales bacterium]|nr:MgtC/SapB family protein [Candidatus Limnocylindrales bacterium]